MLGFFRNYQRYFYLVITFVIVISFSFFGTYSTLTDGSFREQVAFTAVDGSDVTRTELEEMVVFISTDNEDKMVLGGVWGPNFLNDGVIRKDFLETGLGGILAIEYSDALKKDLQTRLNKERRHTLYRHPQAQFVSVENAWEYIAPDIKTHYTRLKQAKNASDPEAFKTRVKLYLAERQLPAPLLRQVLRYQEKQHGWLSPDPNLNYTDLNLFGYKTAENWFGPQFTRLIAQFIINSALIAEERGYSVSKEEAMADLLRQSELSFKQNLNNPSLGVANGMQYFQEQLRRMRMDPGMAAGVWRKVLLFRRLFHDFGNGVFIDPFTFEQFNSYAKEHVSGVSYHLPEALWLKDLAALQKLELYLNAVAQRQENSKERLQLPQKYRTVSEVAQNTPSLVQRRYLIEVAQVAKPHLQARVGMKETWDWELAEKNWEKLTQKFPVLGGKPGGTRDERYTALEALDERTRKRVDTFARGQIVDMHPEWIEEVLGEALVQRKEIGIAEAGRIKEFPTLKEPKALQKLLDRAPLGEDPSGALEKYSPDEKTFYWIRVIDRAPQREVMTFEQANETGVLDRLLDEKLAEHYVAIREENRELYRQSDGEWKPLTEVRYQVSKDLSASLLEEIRTDYIAAAKPENPPKELLGEFAASLRFYPYLRQVQEKAARGSKQFVSFVKEEEPSQESSDTLSKALPLQEQWKLLKGEYKIERSGLDPSETGNAPFTLEPGTWSQVTLVPNGDLHFFLVVEKRPGKRELAALEEQMAEAKTLLSNSAQQALMLQILPELKEKKAISLKLPGSQSDQS